MGLCICRRCWSGGPICGRGWAHLCAKRRGIRFAPFARPEGRRGRGGRTILAAGNGAAREKGSSDVAKEDGTSELGCSGRLFRSYWLRCANWSWGSGAIWSLLCRCKPCGRTNERTNVRTNERTNRRRKRPAGRPIALSQEHRNRADTIGDVLRSAFARPTPLVRSLASVRYCATSARAHPCHPCGGRCENARGYERWPADPTGGAQ